MFLAARQEISDVYCLQGITDPAQLTSTIEALLTWHDSYPYTFTFVFPVCSLRTVTCSTTDINSQSRKPNKSQPYLLPIFAQIIGQVFKPFSALDGHDFKVFEVELEGERKPEVPAQLLAQAAVAVSTRNFAVRVCLVNFPFDRCTPHLTSRRKGRWSRVMNASTGAATRRCSHQICSKLIAFARSQPQVHHTIR